MKNIKHRETILKNRLRRKNTNKLEKCKNKKIDPKYLGIPNICFSLTDIDDKREKKYEKQRIERGFDDSELWSLDYTIIELILPRLKTFNKKYKDTFIKPCNTQKKFIENLNFIIKGFDLYLDEDNDKYDNLDFREKDAIIDKALDAFRRIFRGLWY